MNSYEKEVLQSQLAAERKTLLQLKAIYEQAAKDVSEKLEISNGKIEILLRDIENADDVTRSILQSQIYQRDFQQNLKAQLDLLLKDLNDNQYRSISEYLENSYNNGFIGTLYSLNKADIPVIMPIDPKLVVRAMSIDSKLSKKLYDKLGEDVEKLKKRIANNIARGISTASHYRDIARNIASNSNVGFNRAMRIVRTESGRIYNAASLDSAKAAKEKTGADLVKVWDSLLDSLTRPHHRQLDGQVRELDEDFEISGYKTSAPGHFGIAKEDINCRCVALTKPRWDVDGPFTKRDNESGELMEFQNIQDYEEFKKKYWKTVDNSGESGIIKERGTLRISMQFFAKIPKDKFTKYALDPVKQPDKARAFREALGYTMENYQELIDNISSNLDENALKFKGSNGHGELYEYVMRLTGANGKQANVCTGWIIENGEIEPRLTSAYVTNKKVTKSD